tara:strand:- start:1506 stop:2045 length:540 start_codon:yes stop_codon:yes gene_type:complete
MIIHFKGNLQWKKSAKLVELIPSHNAYFDLPSLAHLFSGFILYRLFNYYVKHSTKTIIVVVIIHMIEDFLENITINNKNYSLEGFLSSIFQCNHPVFFDSQDHDSLQNYIGDNISFLLGTIIGLFTENRIQISINKLWIIFISWILLHPLICHLLNLIFVNTTNKQKWLRVKNLFTTIM